MTASITVFDLGGNSCLVPAGSDYTVAKIKQHGTNALGMEGESIVLLHGTKELKESERLPSGDLNLLLLNRPRPENWDALIQEFCSGVDNNAQELISEFNSQHQELLEDFGIAFAKEVLRQTRGRMAFPFLPQSLKEEHSIVLHAVRQNYKVLEFADARFRSDRAIVLAAVGQTMKGCECCVPFPIAYASEELRDDPEIVFAAWEVEPCSVTDVNSVATGDEWKAFRKWMFEWAMHSPGIFADSAVGHWQTSAEKHADKKNRKYSRKTRFKKALATFERSLNQPQMIDLSKQPYQSKARKKHREMRHEKWYKHIALDQLCEYI